MMWRHQPLRISMCVLGAMVNCRPMRTDNLGASIVTLKGLIPNYSHKPMSLESRGSVSFGLSEFSEKG